MAKLEQGILGPFRGKVGTVVGYLWRGRHVVRGYRKEINYPNTENQRLERDWFVGMVRFAATARRALLLGLREKAAQEQMTEGNVFVKMNKGCFGRVEETVAYEGIRIASGSAAPVRFSAARVDGDGILSVDFWKNSGMTRARGGDRVFLYIYNTETREGLLPAAAPRRLGHVAVQLPDGWNSLNVKVWGFVIDQEGRASASAYVPLADGEPSAAGPASPADDAVLGADDVPVGLHLGQHTAERGAGHAEHLGHEGDVGDGVVGIEMLQHASLQAFGGE